MTTLFFPLALMTFSNCLFLFVEKLLLGRLSTEAMEAAVSVAYACFMFQAPVVALAMMAQVYVGQWYGAKNLKAIGPGMWQFIWFAVLSTALTLPTGLIFGKYYFQDTVIEQIAMPYYHFLISINFLFPLSAALSCFYLGRGKTKLVLWTTLGSQIVKLVFAYLLIFGWNGWIPSLGLIGGALSTAIAQGGFCLLLFLVFLSTENSQVYQSHQSRFNLKLFWECIHPGLLRAINRILSFACWAAIVRLMTVKGGDFLLILTIGGTLNLFLPFLSDAILQAQTTIVSQILGAKNYFMMGKASRSGYILSVAVIIFASIPLLIFPTETFNFLFPKITLDAGIIERVFLGVWVCYIFFTISYIPVSYILAFKDTKFSLFMGCINWINGFLLMYIAIDKVHISADQFWLVLSIMHASTGILYYWRMKVLQSRVLTTPVVA